VNAAALPGALGRHFLLTLRLNFRSKQAIAYGYLMPVLFLITFASIFHGDTPPLTHEMGQLLTISILGSAAIGLPTALVAERERGVWRRYRLLPVSPLLLVTGVLLARLVIVASAALLQLGLARLLYGTALPLHPAQFAVAFGFVAFAFLGVGLVIAALADEVPAVQALGQCVFLPMILIGGVGVPLAVLPDWAQRVSGFMPGRYAVEVIQRSLTERGGLAGAGFPLLALAVIGVAAMLVGLVWFRWDHAPRFPRGGRIWAAIALAAWVAVGAAAWHTGRLEPLNTTAVTYESITADDIARITYDDLPGDYELVTRLAPPFPTAAEAEKMRGFVQRLSAWGPARDADPVQSTRHLLGAAAIADITADPQEAQIARVIFMELEVRQNPEDLKRILAWIILHPDDGTVVSSAPELGFKRQPREEVIRQRVQLYAKKLLGRLVGKIPE
jgi:ABC-2 type transport system permease protein